MERSTKENFSAPMTEIEQYKALERVFDYIDKNDGVTFAEVANHFRQYNGGGFFDSSFRILTTDWGTRAILAYLGDLDD